MIRITKGKRLHLMEILEKNTEKHGCKMEIGSVLFIVVLQVLPLI